MRSDPSRQIVASINQPRSTLIAEVGKRPLEHDNHAVAKSNQEQDVNEQPSNPREKSRDLDLTKLSDVAYFSSDLRVRAAALEVWRVEAGFMKSPETVAKLIDDTTTNARAVNKNALDPVLLAEI